MARVSSRTSPVVANYQRRQNSSRSTSTRKAKFCDGTAITSADVSTRSSERAHRTRCLLAVPRLEERHARQTADTRSCSRLSSPSRAFISYMTLWGTAIVSKAYAQEGRCEGSGGQAAGQRAVLPLAKWQKGQEIDLKRNSYYWLKDATAIASPISTPSTGRSSRTTTRASWRWSRARCR